MIVVVKEQRQQKKNKQAHIWINVWIRRIKGAVLSYKCSKLYVRLHLW